MNLKKRLENEKKFLHWDEALDGSRIYAYETNGKYGWKAKYVKTVDKDENTLSFRQEIYNQFNILVEIHEKYPIDKGHTRINYANN